MTWSIFALLSIVAWFVTSIVNRLDVAKSPAGPYSEILYPFASFSDLKSTYESVNFKKTRYPRHLGKRVVRSKFMAWVSYAAIVTFWVLLSPLLLLIYAFPFKVSYTRVRPLKAVTN